MIELSQEQRQELSRQGNKPLRAVDPATQKVYYIVAGDVYERLGPLLGDDEFDIRDTYAAQEAAPAKAWDDPELDLYNDLPVSCRSMPASSDWRSSAVGR